MQRQGDQVAEAAPGHCILAWKQPVIGREADLGAVVHRACQQQRAQPPRFRRGDGFRKEYPDMSAISGSRPLQRRRHIEVTAGFEKRFGVADPILLVEIDREEVTGVVKQQRIDPGNKTGLPAVLTNAVLTA